MSTAMTQHPAASQQHFAPTMLQRRSLLFYSCRLALLQWQKRRKFGGKRCYISRLAPQSESVPLFVVPKAAAEHTWAALDSRGVFMIEIPGMSTCSMPELQICNCAVLWLYQLVSCLAQYTCVSLGPQRALCYEFLYTLVSYGV